MTQAPLSRSLIVEDDEALLEVLRFVLEDAGYEVEAVANGADALRLASSGAIDLVLLDVKMEGMSGLEVARGLRASKQTRHVLIAIHTGLSESAVRAEFSDYDTYMAKGDDAADLLRLVSAVLLKRPSPPRPSRRLAE